jgi:hypothetical protein
VSSRSREIVNLILPKDLAMQHGKEQPAIRPPLLIGVLIDVSSSMKEPIGNSSNLPQLRLEALRASLDGLVQRIRDYCVEVGEDPRSLLDIFVYGFGFGNFISKLRGLHIPGVQNLLAREGDDPTLSGQELLDRWTEIKCRVAELGRDMLGATPMVEAFSKAEATFAMLRQRKVYRDSPILLVVSDGLPTDPVEAGPELVLASADRMRDQGIVIASCFVAPRDLTLPRTLYEAVMPDWSEGARLMLDCSSPSGDFTAIIPELKDRGWNIPAGARLFGQINQSEILSEFVTAIFPADQDARLKEPTAANSQNYRSVRVFISYSHVDARYLEKHDSILSYISGLQREGFFFWHDRRINAGDLWDAEIKCQIDQSDIALILVSQAFLNSVYCQNVEVSSFVAARSQKNLRLVPILISACDWTSVEWLREIQMLPRDGKNIEQHLAKRGQRMACYLEILETLRSAKAVGNSAS